MSKVYLTVIGSAVVMAVAASSALAQAPEGQRGQGRPGGPGGFLRMLPIMAALDADEDGEISTKEIENAVAALKTLDKDKNGKLTAEELRPEFPGGRGGPGGAGGPGGRGPGGRGPGAEGGAGGRGPGFGPPNPEAFVERAMQFDADKDGKLSKEELGKMAEQMGRGFGGRGGAGRGGDGERPRRPQSESDNL